MTDLFGKLDQIKSKESFFEKIKRWIPGYDGYVNRDNAREIDTLLRNKLASMLEQNKTKIKNVNLNLSRNGKLFESQDLDKLDKKNENCIARFKSASRGYSGAFDIVKIKEEQLNLLYNFDNTLLTEVETINSFFDKLETDSNSGVDITASVIIVSDALDNLIQKFDERENLLKTV